METASDDVFQRSRWRVTRCAYAHGKGSRSRSSPSKVNDVDVCRAHDLDPSNQIRLRGCSSANQAVCPWIAAAYSVDLMEKDSSLDVITTYIHSILLSDTTLERTGMTDLREIFADLGRARPGPVSEKSHRDLDHAHGSAVDLH